MENTLNQVTFCDGRTFRTGDIVDFDNNYGTGRGRVIGARRPKHGPTRVLVEADGFVPHDHMIDAYLRGDRSRDAARAVRKRIREWGIKAAAEHGIVGGAIY